MNNHRLLNTIFQTFFILLLYVGFNGTFCLSIRNDLVNIASDHRFILSTCQLIQDRISNASEVFYPPNEKYFEDIYHHTQTSTILSVCSVEPGTNVDVSIIIQIIKQRRVPFAIKGGGHTSNPKFSSTTGIHIAMRRLNNLIYHPESQTVDLGAGLRWVDVYSALEPHNVTVNGGREGTNGLGGLILGGGHGWKTNQYGLTMDSVVEYELITPNGTIVSVNNVSYPDLFFGLKGGYNNFGIVTNFKMRVVPQTEIYGGILTYNINSSDIFDKFINGAVNFQNNNKDPKAAIELVFYIKSKLLTLRLLLNYDGPVPPNDIFKEFIDIDHIGDVTTQKMVKFWGRSFDHNTRGRYHSVSSKRLSSRLLRKLAAQTLYYYKTLGSKQDADISFLVLHQLPSYLNHSPIGAYNPHLSSTSVFPVCMILKWTLPSDDEYFFKAVESFTNSLSETLIEDGQFDRNTTQISYPNFAIETTPLSMIYGNNLLRLQSIRSEWDPQNVMYLTGGWKL